jgi:hypothetical protein
VYSVYPTNLLSYTIQKLLASTRAFCFAQAIICSLYTSERTQTLRNTRNFWNCFSMSQRPFWNCLRCRQFALPAYMVQVENCADFFLLVLSLFARLANIEDVDPTRMQRHRRASSVASSHSSKSDRDLGRSTSRSSTSSRTSSRTGVKRSPNASRDNKRSSITKAEVFQWIERSR